MAASLPADGTMSALQVTGEYSCCTLWVSHGRYMGTCYVELASNPHRVVVGSSIGSNAYGMHGNLTSISGHLDRS